MSNNPTALVQKLWNCCTILPPSSDFGGTSRDDSPSFRLRGAAARQDGDYVEQFTFLPFLKLVDEQSRPPYLMVAEPSRLLSEKDQQRRDAAATLPKNGELV